VHSFLMFSTVTAIPHTLWKHRELWWQFTKRQVELRHKGSHLGLAWSFLSPLLMLALYVLVFGFIFDGRFKSETEPESRIEYALVVFLGLALHHFVAEVLTTAPTLITGNPNFVKKVVFPLELLPAANLGAAAVHFLITLGLVFVGALLTGAPVTWGVVWLPIIFVPLFLASFGLSLALSGLGVFWRDVSQITQFLVLVLIFASAVFYPISQIPPAAWTFLRFNPLLLLIDEARGAAFWGRSLNLAHLAYLYGCGLTAYLAGATIFQRLRSSFADVL
jgi:lipopolysaccharide transport system permease protein